VLYGFYGGDVYPSDDEDEDQEDLPSQRTANDIEANNETSPLLQRQASNTITPVKGTSEAKAFFMLLKAFVGTGVLFLPKAFVNGGLIFSIVLMVIFGFLTMHCMILLVETSRSFGGKSFGDLGQIIYGEKCKFLVLGSIAISQMVLYV
jgi:proton-coupled amino acid transporter